MATLYQTSSQLRRVIVLVVLGIVIILGIDTFSRFLKSELNPFSARPVFYNEPLAGDTTAVPEPKIPSHAISEESKPLFTIEGVFPSYPQAVTIYKVAKPEQKLNTVENAQRTAATLGFDPQVYTKSTDQDLVWENQKKTRSLIFNIVSQKWKMRTQYFQDADALKTKTLNPDLTIYEGQGKSIASALGFRDTTLQNGSVLAKYAKLGLDGLFTSPITADLADYISIDLFRQLPLAKLKPESQRPEVADASQLPKEFTGKIYTSDPRKGELHMIVSNNADHLTSDVYEFDLTNYEYNTISTMYRYSLSPAEAWDNVRAGKGSLTLIQPQLADYFSTPQVYSVTKFAVDAKQTEIAYWEPETWDGFIYPIYIFRGRVEFSDNKSGTFTFYVDALKRF